MKSFSTACLFVLCKANTLRVDLAEKEARPIDQVIIQLKGHCEAMATAENRRGEDEQMAGDPGLDFVQIEPVTPDGAGGGRHELVSVRAAFVRARRKAHPG